MPKYKISTEELEYQLENLIKKRATLIEQRTYIDDPTYKNPPTQKEIDTRVEIKRIRATLRQRNLNKNLEKMDKSEKYKQEYEKLCSKYVEKREKLDQEEKEFYAKVSLDKKIDDILRTQELILENQHIIIKNIGAVRVDIKSTERDNIFSDKNKRSTKKNK